MIDTPRVLCILDADDMFVFDDARRAPLPLDRCGADTRGMSPEHIGTLRVAAVAEVGVVAELLDAFNREYHTPTPGAGRSRRPAQPAARRRHGDRWARWSDCAGPLRAVPQA